MKEFRNRGWIHTAKSLFRAAPGYRSFNNGIRLEAAGIGVAGPLILSSDKTLGMVQSELLMMEVIPGALELDRYILTHFSDGRDRKERNDFINGFAEFLGNMHTMGFFHSDMKTCNVFVSKHLNPESDIREQFYLVDYDDVAIREHVPVVKRVKNLVQLFLSTPTVIGMKDRMRFLRRYAAVCRLDRREARRIASSVLKTIQNRNILFVGFDGDVIQDWRRPDRPMASSGA
jgi:serine/threonine protein kinase